ncbi:serine/threonine protein kinase [Pyricularia oryzae 70-15]|uniref:non-specific serine/threonine protein kinase n=1 Tax=Pyricularia oryzae (strain 70-15 / ATCC MYA-4617 / FGSC 8958) TaxID=242507 RepID=G4NLP4_PYRO7|nr:serine/threonine protein kinase [Pyricularia oryzae 70-15]EHA46097.1 serine/threonine protein kinase [Pyricularia oryzae 70-15]
MPQNSAEARAGESLQVNCFVRSYQDFKDCGKKVRDGLRRETKVLCEHLKPSQAALYRVPTFKCTSFQEDGGLFEEENHKNFARGDFYPVELGRILKGTSYQTLIKLGWGDSSTAWMAFDLMSETFVALKICTRLSPEADRQEDCQRRMSIHANPKHPGYPFINHTRPVEPIRRPGGPTRSKPSSEIIPNDERHACLVQKPMWRYWATVYSSPCWRNHHLRRGTKQLLFALDYLHTECGLVHGNVCEANVGYRVPLDETIVRETLGLIKTLPSRTTAARAYVKTVTARDCTDFTLYRSTRFDEKKLGKTTDFCKVLLGSFGQTRVAYEVWDPEGTPKSMYMAPEVLLGLEVTFAADVWNLGLMLWKLWRREYLINGSLDCDGDNPILHWNSTSHMASIVSKIGPPPKDMLERGRFSGRYFTPEGLPRMDCTNQKHERTPKNDSFEDLVWSMVRWRPEDRKTPKQLLEHPWLSEEL